MPQTKAPIKRNFILLLAVRHSNLLRLASFLPANKRFRFSLGVGGFSKISVSLSHESEESVVLVLSISSSVGRVCLFIFMPLKVRCGVDRRVRTADIIRMRDALYQLSYID